MGLAFVVTMLVFPYVLAFARRHGIVDNPNARKLQRVPVPVMGGTTVFIGVMVAVLVCAAITGDYDMLELLGLVMVMYLIGLWDDVKDVPVALRFANHLPRPEAKIVPDLVPQTPREITVRQGV